MWVVRARGHDVLDVLVVECGLCVDPHDFSSFVVLLNLSWITQVWFQILVHAAILATVPSTNG